MIIKILYQILIPKGVFLPPGGRPVMAFFQAVVILEEPEAVFARLGAKCYHETIPAAAERSAWRPRRAFSPGGRQFSFNSKILLGSNHAEA
jgi:hypothetical protein